MDVIPPISKAVFIRLGKLALNDIVMLTHDGYYLQKRGLAMGCNLSALLANVWMTQFDEKIKTVKSRW